MGLKLNTVITGDSAIVLKEFPSDCIDLTVTSPPYDNMRSYKGNASFDFETIARELYRVTKPGGVVVWVVGDETINGSETLTSFRQAIFFNEFGFNVETMIYQTNKPPENNEKYQSEFEFMFILSKGNIKTFNPIMIKSLHPGVRHTGGHRDKNGKTTNYERIKDRTAEYKLKGNIWYFPRSSNSGDSFSNDHPATFPDNLARDHIISWSNKGDTVLDPFAGSGTTLKVAKALERNYIGIEREPEYIEIIKKRLENTLPLFDQIQKEDNKQKQLSIIE